MSPGSLPADPGLLHRFRQAGEKIAWRSADRATASLSPRRARIAHLHDEESRVEDLEDGRGYCVVTDSGPVGALVLLLEIDRRGPPDRLRTHDAGELPAFPQGALEAVWGGAPSQPERGLPLLDLVKLARYALA
ncbi:MAG: hypothetical protein L3K19_05410 [Thermoplasmata archaeon]|nr:hypothetical protein [Thermoplasmata archaeon]